MAHWIDIPAHRVLEVPKTEFYDLYEPRKEDGEPTQEGDRIYRVVRKADYKVFNIARFIPVEWWDEEKQERYYLEEV